MTKEKTNDHINIYRQINEKLKSGVWADKDVRQFLRDEKAITSFYEAIKTKDPVYDDMGGAMPSRDDVRREGPCSLR